MLRFLLLFFLLTSCTPKLQVQTQYLTHDYLASSQIGSPDPKLLAPFVGKRLLINWNVPQTEGLQLRIYLLKKNYKQEEINFFIPNTIKKHSKGTLVHDLSYDEFMSCGGLISYRVELLHHNEIIQEWNHPLWTTIIRFENKN